MPRRRSTDPPDPRAARSRPPSRSGLSRAARPLRRRRSVGAGWHRPRPAARARAWPSSGRSGAGKSTLAEVLLRFLPYQAGSVTPGRVELDALAGDDVRTVVGLAAQDAHVFDTTLRGEPAAGPARRADERASAHALERARLLAWVEQLPRRLDTGSGERRPPVRRPAPAPGRGPHVAGRLSRAVLDEPGEHLDTATADALVADLLDLTRGRTTAADHPPAGRDGGMDEVIVLDAGRVVERGTHAELLAAGGRLRRAVGAQAAGRSTRWPRWEARVVSLDAERHDLDLARVQFATTSIYHFLFVPVTIGLAFLVAILQTMWHRSGNPETTRLTRFFGTLLLINVAIGVVTGLVQEFEFGMNWSAYSRFVGDVFGAPLAMEGLAAFFLESTFLGSVDLRLGPPAQAHPPGVHLAGRLRARCCPPPSSWPPTRGCSTRSATPSTRARASRSSTTSSPLFTNPVFLWGYTHVLLASAVTGALVMLAVSAWHLRRASSVRGVRAARPRCPWWCWCRPSCWPCSWAASWGWSRPSTSP